MNTRLPAILWTTPRKVYADDRLIALSVMLYIFVACVVILPRLAGLYAINIFDDAFITFRHSENLAAGHGLVFNQDDRVLGTTTPLLALLLAAARLAGLAVPPTAQFIGIASDVFTALLLYRLLGRDLGRFTAMWGIALMAIDPHIIRVSVGGMESSLFLALSTLTIALILARRAELAFPLASVSMYVRPEAGLLWLASLFDIVFRNKPTGKKHVMSLVLGLILAAAPLGFIYFYYGSILPQSIASKANMPRSSLGEVIQIFFFPAGSVLQGFFTLLAPFGLVMAWKRSRFVALLATWAGVYFLSYALARPQVWTWYALPVYFAKATLAGLGLAWLLRRMAPKLFQREATALLTTGALAALCILALIAVMGGSPVREHVYQPLQAWCATNTTGRETIAAGDVGAIGYYCNAFVYDLAGLVWPERHNFQSHLEVVENKKPDYIFAEVSSYWSVLFDPTSSLRQRYEPVLRLSRYGRKDVDVSLSSLAKGWQQDYVLFRRVDQHSTMGKTTETLIIRPPTLPVNGR